jgi:hypothetical protein
METDMILALVFVAGCVFGIAGIRCWDDLKRILTMRRRCRMIECGPTRKELEWSVNRLIEDAGGNEYDIAEEIEKVVDLPNGKCIVKWKE